MIVNDTIICFCYACRKQRCHQRHEWIGTSVHQTDRSSCTGASGLFHRSWQTCRSSAPLLSGQSDQRQEFNQMHFYVSRITCPTLFATCLKLQENRWYYRHIVWPAAREQHACDSRLRWDPEREVIFPYDVPFIRYNWSVSTAGTWM